jgi:hypothetical protein
MGELQQRIRKTLEERRNKVLSGKINCIPLPFKRFRSEWPGIEQGKYYLVSGSTKAAKTQLANYIFVYNTVMWTYKHPNIIHPKIFYFPLEETPENITLRFMAFVINYLTEGKLSISPADLKSTDERKPLEQEVLDIMDSLEFNAILDHYESIVTFYDSHNIIGINKTMCDYAQTHGETFFKTIKVKELDDKGQIKEVDRKIFDHYIPDDPNEYVMFIVDHISLLEPIKNMDLRESICALSENCVTLRNRYNYIPIIIQQQSVETSNAEAVKNNKIRPTVAGLGDGKYTARDANLMIGICNPHSFDLPQYLGYDITKLRGNIRFMEIVLNRDGEANGICPLIFNGAINKFKEAPNPNKTEELDKIYESLEAIRAAKRAPKMATALLAWAYKQI